MKILSHEYNRVQLHPYSTYSYEIKPIFYNFQKSAVENSGFDMRYVNEDNIASLHEISLHEIKNNMKYYQYLQTFNSHYTKDIDKVALANMVLEELYFNRCSRSKYGSNLFCGLQEDNFF